MFERGERGERPSGPAEYPSLGDIGQKLATLGRGRLWMIVVAVVVIIWLLSGLYCVDPGEKGVVRRFGKESGKTDPGLNYHLPWPIEKVTTVNMEKIRIAQIGFQPRMVESLAPEFPLRVLDLDPHNIGTRKFGVIIEGPENRKEAIGWADFLVVTGTTLVNGTLGGFLGRKPILFYGTSIAGGAHLMNWDRFCPKST